ncbi:DNA cytosine methyltransferase [Haloferula sp. A504]|uniref:DNA cytosine methyltransferase n=1 Tax=Haloferula sp. A504 TaxID=3373601 RepID=UPI0031C66828|nr:DNA cytosine methyltransferase [Verrucomicrobiaceae bacterium E54]
MTSGFPTFVDFFAGSGLVTQGAQHACTPVWSNDICPKKAAIYTANHGTGHFHQDSIENVNGSTIPQGDIVWASFPCQDLSLAGKMGGLAASRSGLFWEWLRVLDEMPERPKVIALENVTGLLSSNGGEDYRLLHKALRARSYRIGPMVIDARHWLPQSRPRVFVVAVQEHFDATDHEDLGPNWLHSDSVTQVITSLEGSVFWSMPFPKNRPKKLSEIIDWEVPVFDEAKTEQLLSIIAARHTSRLKSIPKSQRAVFPGYRRTRNGKQVLELRFDNISGCLRTAEGGSSRQFLILHEKGKWTARLITTREAARLMGAPDSYQLAANYNEAYSAMGDAVAVPVVKHLAEHLLAPLAKLSKSYAKRSRKESARIRLSA